MVHTLLRSPPAHSLLELTRFSMIVAVGALFFSFLFSPVFAASPFAPSVSVDATGLIIKVALKNTGDKPLKFFNDPRSILSNTETTIFDISARSCKPLFTGSTIIYNLTEAAKSSNPLDFTVLAPGQTINVEHNLADSYDFTRCGQGPYSVRAFKRLYHLDESGVLEAIETSANSGQFQISSAGQPSSPSRSTHNSTISKRDALFVGCDNNQKFQIMKTAIIADYLVRNANTYLAAFPSGQSDRHYTTWFGEFDQSRHSTVQAHFSNIGEKATKFTYDCRACKSKFGFRYHWMDGYVKTHPRSSKEIYLCKKFWGAPWVGRGSKAGVIIRALSHFPENGGTTDYHITSEEVLELAVRDPKGAVLNADNHRYFAEETYLDYLKQQSSTEGQGHKKQSDGEQPDVTSSASSSAAGGPSTSRHPRRLASRD
ncbi:unnamed protein product [Rhizoctonia solani]|uniref:Lysine-specific metallo-endopeptidase domain-containing protein n=1 Tax=Rhizoctonia solani TaxID=456999 RepID=A0A8H3AP46_9AGAM|nr:unnamed protein product [Rhizoctonia solani]